MLSEICFDLLQLRTNKASTRESLCNKLHDCCKSDKLKSLLAKVSGTNDVETCMFLLNNILKQSLQLSFAWRNEKLLSKNLKEIDVKL